MPGGTKPESRPAEIILLVEDSSTDAVLITRAFEHTGVENPIRRVKDGEEALGYLTGAGAFADRKENPLPAVILLDLNLSPLQRISTDDLAAHAARVEAYSRGSADRIA